jgi:ornithine cyclodeaminase/alanine dehydrogenase-like protein (mu-crystallin family)
VISGVGSLLVVGAGDIAEVGEELSSAITGATRVSIAPKEQSAMNRLARTFDLPEAM